MDWGLFVLIVILFICFTVLLYLQIPNFDYFIENYFLIVLIILFIILIFTIDFNNPITTTVYIRTAKNQSPLVYSVPYNGDTNFSNLISASFVGTYSIDTTPVNNTPANDTKVFNFDLFDTVTLLGGKITITKDVTTPYQLQVAIDPNSEIPIDGFLTMSLVCTGSQSISGSFQQIQ